MSQYAVESQTLESDWSKEKRCYRWKAGSQSLDALFSQLYLQKTELQILLTENICWLSKKQFPLSANFIFLPTVTTKFCVTWMCILF